MHQTTHDLRSRVVACLEQGGESLPEPNMKDLSRELAQKILRTVRKGGEA